MPDAVTCRYGLKGRRQASLEAHRGILHATDSAMRLFSTIGACQAGGANLGRVVQVLCDRHMFVAALAAASRSVSDGNSTNYLAFASSSKQSTRAVSAALQSACAAFYNADVATEQRVTWLTTMLPLLVLGALCGICGIVASRRNKPKDSE